MRHKGVLLLLAFVSQLCQADELDDWLIPEPYHPLLLGFSYQINEDSDTTLSTNLSIPIKGVSVLDIGFSRSELSDDNFNFTSNALDARLQMDVSDNLNLTISYDRDGHDDELEISHYGLGIRYFHSRYFIEILSEDGQLILFSRDELNSLNRVPEKSDMSKDGVALTIGWWTGDYSFEVFHQYYDYGKDIAALGDSAWLQLLVKPEVLSLSNLLIDEQSRFSLSHLHKNRIISLHWISDVSAIDQQRLDTWQFDYSDELTKTIDGSISVSSSEDSDWAIAMGLIWQL